MGPSGRGGSGKIVASRWGIGGGIINCFWVVTISKKNKQTNKKKKKHTHKQTNKN